MTTVDIIIAAMTEHRRDRDQSKVWLPMVGCVCGAVVPSGRFRRHIAEEIAKAVES